MRIPPDIMRISSNRGLLIARGFYGSIDPIGMGKKCCVSSDRYKDNVGQIWKIMGQHIDEGTAYHYNCDEAGKGPPNIQAITFYCPSREVEGNEPNSASQGAGTCNSSEKFC